MSAFDDFNAAGATFGEAMMGQTFSYAPASGSPTVSGLLGIFTQPVADYVFGEFSVRSDVSMLLTTSKAQWAGTVPADRGVITYNSLAYVIETIDGLNDPSDQSYTLHMKVRS